MSTKIIEQIDYYLDHITMYRLVLYVLIVFIVAAAIFGIFGLVPFSFISIIFSATFLVFISWLTNNIFSIVFKAPTNIESVFITSLILALIITPFKSANGLIFLAWAAIWGTASKYIFAIGKKHIFNPAAVAVLLTSMVIGQAASWWIGTKYFIPFVFLGGILIVRKIRKIDMVYSLIMTVLITTFIFAVSKNSNVFTAFNNILFNSSLFFFAFVMFTEPLTSPPTKNLQIIYGILVGILFTPQFHIGGLYFTPELALICGNVFSYLVSPKQKLLLTLSTKIPIAPGIYNFIFIPQKPPKFSPGQYMEWTLPHKNADDRGNRRYFTIASSPSERALRLGIKFNQNGSSFKKALMALDAKSSIVAGQLAGDFTLPEDKNKKLAFIAGGIGITPFRSMIKYLLDLEEARPITLFYSNKYANEIVYADIFHQADKNLGIKTVYTLTETEFVPSGWLGKIGRINEVMIKSEVPDYSERIFYLSGPHTMVTAFEDVLRGMGISKNKIKTDFFPGFV